MERQSMARPFAWMMCLSLGVCMLVGCGDSGSASVFGVVSYQGEPVKLGTIRFFPQAGGRPSVGQIQPDGSYELSTKVPGDGAPPGIYAIAIEAVESSTVGEAPTSIEEEIEMGPARSEVKHLVPPKYGSQQTSGLTRTVEAGSNEMNFELE